MMMQVITYGLWQPFICPYLNRGGGGFKHYFQYYSLFLPFGNFFDRLQTCLVWFNSGIVPWCSIVKMLLSAPKTLILSILYSDNPVSFYCICYHYEVPFGAPF